MIRNENAPIFFDSSYEVTIRQDLKEGSQVAALEAEDADTDPTFSNVKYAIIGDDTAPTYFVMNAESGQITVQSSLEMDLAELYRVRWGRYRTAEVWDNSHHS